MVFEGLRAAGNRRGVSHETEVLYLCSIGAKAILEAGLRLASLVPLILPVPHKLCVEAEQEVSGVVFPKAVLLIS